MTINSVFSGDNAGLIAYVAPLWIPPDALVLDDTYGGGGWWKQWRPERLIAHDRYTLDGVDFRQLPELDASVDVVAFDPPYVSTGNPATSTVPDLYARYGIGQTGWRATFELVAAGMKEATRVLVPRGRLLVKCCDFVESGQRRWGHDHVVTTARNLGLRQRDEVIHISGTGPQPARPRQLTTRRAHSFLCLFETPPRP